MPQFGSFDLHFYRAFSDLLFTATANVVILAFLLVVIVEGERLPNSENWLFANLLTCNSAAYFVESGATSPNQKRGTQKGISAYCIPRTVSKTTNLWY